jgi:hypothetical protein
MLRNSKMNSRALALNFGIEFETKTTQALRDEGKSNAVSGGTQRRESSTAGGKCMVMRKVIRS